MIFKCILTSSCLSSSNFMEPHNFGIVVLEKNFLHSDLDLDITSKHQWDVTITTLDAICVSVGFI